MPPRHRTIHLEIWHVFVGAALITGAVLWLVHMLVDSICRQIGLCT